MPDPFQKEIDVAVQAVKEAARLCRSVQMDLAGSSVEKSDRSPVTVADFGSQALVCHVLQQAFPDDVVVAEEDASMLRQEENEVLLDQVLQHVKRIRPEAEREHVLDWIGRGGASNYQDRFWVLDPIDGTKGFLRNDQYAVALALIVGGDVKVAALACPNIPSGASKEGTIGTVFAAVRGRGAIEMALDEHEDPVTVRVSETAESSLARFCESFESGHSSHGDAARIAESLGITTEPLRMDSQAKYGVVARGQADLYLRLPTRAGYVERVWDHAAGLLVIQEAGGKVTDINGSALDFRYGRGLEKNRGVVASNGLLHDRVLEVLVDHGIAG